MQPNREVTDLIPVSQDDMRGALVPRNMGEAMECAKIMSTGRVSLPAFLRNNPGDCLRIVGIATRTGLDPFMLANHFYLTKSKSGEERMAAEAQAVHAIAMASGLIHGDLNLKFAGQAPDLSCTVTGTTRNGTTHTHIYFMKSIQTRNSPLWRDQPQQQLGYYSERAWCRLHAPGAMMGLIARGDPVIDVSAGEAGPEEAKTETDKVLEHLSGTPESGQKGRGGDEGTTAASADDSTSPSPPAETETADEAAAEDAPKTTDAVEGENRRTAAPYECIKCDGVVAGCHDADTFGYVMKVQIGEAPNKAARDGLWDSNQDTMNALRSGTDIERAIAAEIETAFDEADPPGDPAPGKLV